MKTTTDKPTVDKVEEKYLGFTVEVLEESFGDLSDEANWPDTFWAYIHTLEDGASEEEAYMSAARVFSQR